VGGAAKFIRLSPDLVMERSNSYTASLNYGKTINGRQYSFLAEGFFTRLNNPFILSDQTELPSGVAVITKRNGEGASVYGVNLEGNIAFSRKLILQTGATLQRAVYDEEEVIWEPEPGDNLPVAATTRILRTPNAYGYGTLQYNPTERWALAYSGVVTGSMVVPHVIDPDNEQTVIKSTPSFFEHNLRVSYTLPFGDDFNMQLFGGVQNMFNAFQRDFDVGSLRDAGYIYGPARPRTLFVGLKLNIK
jgi:outer membrane receptor for ferrienterochelin and colicins